MKNENRAAFGRISEQSDFAFELPPADDILPADSETPAEPTTRRSLASRLIDFIAGKLRQRRNRFALLELTEDQLKDIGLSRGQAYSGDYSRYRRSASHALERKGL